MYRWMTSSGLEADGGTREWRVKETESTGNRMGWIKTTSPPEVKVVFSETSVGWKNTKKKQKGFMRLCRDGMG